MRVSPIGFVVAVLMTWQTNAVFALDGAVAAKCIICTCENGAVLCLDGPDGSEVVEEQGLCGPACSEINSSYKSNELVETSCEDLPTCDHADTPAASPLAMSIAGLGLVGFGTLLLRRNRVKSAA